MNICIAWALATQAIAVKLDVIPLPPGLSEATVGRWNLVVNNSKLELPASVNGVETDLPPYEVAVSMTDYLVFGLLGPAGGMIGGGVTEDEFIADMVANLPKEALEPYAEELEQRKDRLS